MFIIQTPARYLQGKGILDSLGTHVKQFADNFLVLSGKTALKMKQKEIEMDCASHHLSCTFVAFGGESTSAEVERVIGIIKEKKCGAVIGMGGGKVLDTAKSAAFKCNLPIIIVPTIASSNAPCSCEAMIYSPEGLVVDCEIYPRNPDLVLVDSEIIANAPTPTLVAGIGDAISTYLEARTCYENHYANIHHTGVSETAFALSKICYDLLINNGRNAKGSVEEKVVTPALEKTIEAIFYLSGVGFENSGLSCAHSIHDALTALPECHPYMHGYKVAFGGLCHLLLENRPSTEVLEYLKFSTEIGLPITFEQLGIMENVEKKIKEISSLAFIKDPLHECKMPPEITADDIYTAMMMADKLGRQFLSDQ